MSDPDNPIRMVPAGYVSVAAGAGAPVPDRYDLAAMLARHAYGAPIRVFTWELAAADEAIAMFRAAQG